MIRFHQDRLLPFSREHLYGIISDVASYPHFVPWCKSCTLTGQCFDGSLTADMLVGFDGLAATYQSKITLTPPDTVEVLGDGNLFDHLSTKWQLQSLGPTMTHVSFDLAFAFKSSMLQTLAGSAFEKVAHKIMDAFEQRARDLGKAPF